ncbi:MAG: hypothetical protein ACJ77D_04695 [Chloroflexota bacterium]
MSRRVATSSLVLVIAASLALALPSVAKEGAEAKLDTTLHRDAEPGSTIDVGWSLFSVFADETNPLPGAAVYLRLIGFHGNSSTEVMGTETPRGSGHYKGSIRVPDGGIRQVLVGVVGESCIAGAACDRSDMIFPLTDDPLVVGSPPKAAAAIASAAPGAVAAPAVPPIEAPSATATTSVSSQLAPLVGIGIGVAIAAGVAALVLARRRTIEAPAGR